MYGFDLSVGVRVGSVAWVEKIQDGSGQARGF